MKIITTLSLLIVFSLAGHAQDSKKELKKQQKVEEFVLMNELVKTGAYEFIGLRALPQKGNQVDLTTRDNFMRIKDGKASAELPFFGRVFSASAASTDSGINFNDTLEDYQIEANDKKLRLLIKFKVKAKAENFNCTLVISSLETASLTIISSQRSSMTYQGVVTTIDADK